jgi:peptide/nickel transport system substrate-binding protein
MKYRRMWLMIVVAHLIVLTGPIVAAGPATPQPTQLLRVGVSSEPPGLDIQWQTATMTQDIMHHVYEFLVTMDRNLDFKPMLAEKMDVSRDGKIFTIFLRKGVFFHNGKELSAEDVIASMERWVRLEARARRFMQDRESVRARDKYTVEVRFRQPNGAFQSAIAIHNNLLSIMPKEIVEKYWNPDPRGTEIKDVADLIGTGPYRVVEWARDRHVRLVRFDRYAPRTDPSSGMAGQRTAHAQEMRFVVIKDDVTRLNALIAGEIDVAHTLSPAQYAQVRLNAALDPYIVKPGGAPVGVFNKSPGNMFRNEKLRNAVHWSIDYGKVMAG